MNRQTVARDRENAQPDWGSGTLDLDYIRRKIPIQTIAYLLGIDVDKHHFAKCWRTENHPNGDANPSLHFLTRKNCAICFRCDSRAMTNIDFVMAVRSCDFRGALRWFRQEYGRLPTLRGRPAGVVRDKPFRVGASGSDLEGLVRSGVFRSLSSKALRVLFVIDNLREDAAVRGIPYRTLLRYTGIGSKTTIKEALDELVALHLLEIRKSDQKSADPEPRNLYVLTPQDPKLLDLMNQTFRADRDGVDAECNYYRAAKLARQAERKRASRSATRDNASGDSTNPEPTNAANILG